jgi:ribokinase
MGGKGANQAVAAARMGARVTMLGQVGRDELGGRMLASLAQEGIDTRHIRQLEGMQTGSAFILLEHSGSNRIVSVPGANVARAEDQLRTLELLLKESELLLLQYEIDMEMTEQAIALAYSHGVPVMLNPGPVGERSLSPKAMSRVSVITPNETEAEALTGIAIRTPADARKAGAALTRSGVGKAIVTLGERGAVVVGGESDVHIPAYKVKPVDTVAAGDTFTGALAVRLCSGDELEPAVRYACAAAALAVTREGAMESIPCMEEVEQLLANGVEDKAL